jgi:type I restriction enzyme S subunit
MSSYFQKMIDDFQVGVSREGLSKSSMEKIPIPLSSIAEQARIVKKVKLIYQLIDELAEKYRSEQEERQKLVVSSMARLAKGQSSLELDKITEIIKTKPSSV